MATLNSVVGLFLKTEYYETWIILW